MKHRIAAGLLSRPVTIALVGVGGNGSQMLTGLARLAHALEALGHPGFVVVAFDPDDVSAANVGRQHFSPSDVGLNKATVLVHRVNAFYGFTWEAKPQRYARTGADIVISCVDSRAARAAIAPMVTKACYWLDLGNRAADGQVLLGTPSAVRNDLGGWLPSAPDLFPDIADKSIPEDDAPSCSLAQALERQELFVNQAVVTPALEILWRLFRHGEIEWHGAFVNLARGTMRPLPVDAEAWRRMGLLLPHIVGLEEARA